MRLAMLLALMLFVCGLLGCASSAMVPLANGDTLYFARHYGIAAVECQRWDGSYCHVRTATPSSSSVPSPMSLMEDVPPL